MTKRKNPPGFRGHRFPSEIIQHAVWLYYRFGIVNLTPVMTFARESKPRNWQPAGAVWLNPERETGAPEIRDAA